MENLSTVVTRDDRANAWTDEHGVKYSADKRRLLRVPDDLQECVVADGCRVICDGAFAWCDALTCIWLPETVAAVGENVLDGCNHLTAIRIPAGTTAHFENMLPALADLLQEGECTAVQEDDRCNFWKDCTGAKYSADRKRLLKVPGNLQEYSVVEGCQVICDGAFDWCEELTIVYLPETINAISINVFDDCQSLSSIIIPVGTRKDYESLLPAKKTLLEEFNYCTKVTKEDLANAWLDECGVKYSADKRRLLWAPRDLQEYAIINGCKIICDEAFGSYKYDDRCCEKMTKIQIPDSVMSIGAFAFYGCLGLTNILMPGSLTSIGRHAFERCAGLSVIFVLAGNPKYDSRNNCNAIIETESNTLVVGCQNTIIPTGVTIIGEDAFSGRTGLTSIEIPHSVTCIGEDAFSNCTELADIEMPNGVTSIGDCAFSGCSGLKSVTIPNSVTNIDRHAFDGCVALTSIVIPNSVTSIGVDAFANTAWYDSQPDGLIYAGNVAYKYKGMMFENTNIVLKDGTLGIGERAFYECTRLASVVISNSVTNIGRSAFHNCTGLKRVVIPDSVTRIEYGAFYGCKKLASVTIPNSVTSIGKDAFLYVKNIIYSGPATGNPWGALNVNGAVVDEFIYADIEKKKISAYIGTGKNAVIPNGVMSVGDYAFSDCTELTNITMPNALTSIGIGAFYSCTGLSDVTIPDSVKSIGKRAFYGCAGLKNVDLPVSLTNIGESAFSGCSSLHSISIPDNVTQLEESVFYRCSCLTSVSLPENLTSIGSKCFDSWSKHLTIYVPLGMKDKFEVLLPNFKGELVERNDGTDVSTEELKNAWVDEFRVKYSADKRRLLWAPRDLQEYVIKKGCKIICNKAFVDCTDLTRVTMPDSITCIGDGAFLDCVELMHIEIPSNVISIGIVAFSNCIGLKCVTIPSSVKCIGQGAFGLVKNVIYEGDAMGSPWGALNVNGVVEKDFVYAGIEKKEITAYVGNGDKINIPDGVTSIGIGAFSGCTGITSIEIPNGVTSIGLWAFSGCTGLKSINVAANNQKYDSRNSCNAIVKTESNKLVLGCKNTIVPNSVTSIGNGAFRGCTGLTSLSIPNSVTIIDMDAFKGCTGLMSIAIPDDVTDIGMNAFEGCTGLRSITIPDSMTSIKSWTFSDCTGLMSVEIPNGVKNIDIFAFSGCTGLANIVIPNSVTSIGESAFRGCTGLANIVIPNSVTSIDDNAFCGCMGLKCIIVPNSVTSIGDNAFEDCKNLNRVFIPKGSREKFEKLLPKYKHKLVEQ